VARSPEQRIKWVAGAYALLAVTPVGVFVIFLDVMDWRVDRLFRNLDITGDVFLGLLLAFLVNTSLALGAWNFLKASRPLRTAVLSVAVAVAAWSVTGLAWDAWSWLQGSPRFKGADEATIVSGLGGRSLLAISYIVLFFPLARALRSAHVRAKG